METDVAPAGAFALVGPTNPSANGKPPRPRKASVWLSDPLAWLEVLNQHRLQLLVTAHTPDRAKVPKFTRGKDANRVNVADNVRDALEEYGEAEMLKVCLHMWQEALDGPLDREAAKMLACTFSGGGGGWGIRVAAYAKATAPSKVIAVEPVEERTDEAIAASVAMVENLTPEWLR